MPVRRAPVGRKSIYDPIHGMIPLEGLSLELVGQSAFQRLWGIRQTGFAHLVFPGANHTRLEHSLGVFWVAREMARRLALSPGDTALLEAGALLHDLGHTPFSHTLEPTLREVAGVGHEGVSRARVLGEETRVPAPGGEPEVLPRTLERYGLVPRSAAELIDPSSARERRRLLVSLLHGAIDADRIDYLQRDAHYTGVAHGAIDALRLLDTVRARGKRVVFAEKGRSAVEGFLVGRALMYSSVYYHKTVRAAEVMAQAAVERQPGFPESAAPLLASTDAELLVRLRDAAGPSSELVRALLARRLYKRARGWKGLEGPSLRAWRRLASDPVLRRCVEDETADRLGAPAGSVLFDVAGLEARNGPGSDWTQVGVLEDGRVTYPFRGDSTWSDLARRPPTEWAVATYVAPRWRAAAERVLGRSGGWPPGR